MDRKAIGRTPTTGRQRKAMAAAIVAAALVAAPASAAEEPRNPERVPVIQQLFDCRAITDPTQRLACFDRQVAAIETAEAARDIRIVDRAQVRETRRGLFGFSLGRLNIFGGGDEEEDELNSRNNPEIVQEIEATISRLDRDPTGRWVFGLDNGQRWVQADAVSVGRSPRVGHKIKIRRAAFGTFMANVEDRPGFRVRREQ